MALKQLEYAEDQLEADVKRLVDELTKEEAEAAACCSYHYYQQSRHRNDTFGRYIQAENMARRTLTAARGDYDLSLECIRETLQWRVDMQIEEMRDCFSSPSSKQQTHHTDQERKHRELAERIAHELECGWLFVRGYDREKRAILHFSISKLSGAEIVDAKLWMQSFVYMMERALAISRHDKITVAVDFGDFSTSMLPPTVVMKEMVDTLSKHYCERLHRVYLVDAPFWFSSVWFLLKPLLDPKTKQKFQFVTGSYQKETVIGRDIGAAQAMPYLLPQGELTTPVDIPRFLYEIPFDQNFDDCTP